jgi:hypothetical protein
MNGLVGRLKFFGVPEERPLILEDTKYPAAKVVSKTKLKTSKVFFGNFPEMKMKEFLVYEDERDH